MAAALECPHCGTTLPPTARQCTACGGNPAARPRPSRSGGAVIDGRWRLDKPIGQGGMGTVWVGRDLQLERMVAVKVLAQEHAQNPEFVDRFIREAQLLSRLNHPNIVTLYGVGRTGAQPFLVMRYLKGVPLSDHLGQPMPVPVALALLRQLCAGLFAMHQAGILHRDIKPANLLVSESGQLTILDLGIARPGDSSLTKTGVVYGTVGYMSPEQMLGEKNLDGRSDLYSVGVVAWEMLSGRKPFESSDDYVELFKRMTQVRPELRKHAPNISPEVAKVVSSAVAFDKADRPADVAAFWKALEAAAKAPARKSTASSLPAPAPAAPPSGARGPNVHSAPTEQLPPMPRQKSQARPGWPLWTGLGLAVVVLAGAGAYWAFG